MSEEDQQTKDNPYGDRCDTHLVIDQRIYGTGSLLTQKGQSEIFHKIPLAFFLVHPALRSKPDFVINQEIYNNGLLPFTYFF